MWPVRSGALLTKIVTGVLFGGWGVHAMRYLAVPEMPVKRGLWTALRHWGLWAPEWHAVAETIPTSKMTVCGALYSSEALRTWGQTLPGDRCPQCTRLVGDESADAVTFIAEAAS